MPKLQFRQDKFINKKSHFHIIQNAPHIQKNHAMTTYHNQGNAQQHLDWQYAQTESIQSQIIRSPVGVAYPTVYTRK